MGTPLPQAIELYVRSTLPTIDGWRNAETCTALARCVLEEKPEFAIEIGVYEGRGLIAIALAMRENGAGKVIGIDPWSQEASVTGWSDQNKDWWGKLDHHKVMQNCETHISEIGVKDQVELIRLGSIEALQGIRDRNLSVGLLSIDGNRSAAQSSFDVSNYVPLVKNGGYVFFEDAHWSTTQSAVRLLMKVCKLKEIVGNCAVFVKI